ncbi:MAG: deazaflavin-dependent nitroreductase, partial [Geodermatophilaceae bacterium]|nr:deazaflavin-dependent nitroreductase [Geodermatophilaceae bacterium]
MTTTSYRRPGAITRRVMNPFVAGLTKRGLS